MKIALVGNSDISIVGYRTELIERLVSLGHEVYIVCPYGELLEPVLKLGCTHINTVVDRHGTNPLKDMKLLKSYKKIFGELRPDIVLAYTIKPNIYASIACRKYKIPVVVNVTGLGSAVENPGWKQVVTTMLYKNAFKKVKTVFFQNEENKNFFEERKIANDKHKLLPGSGVNLERFKLCDYPEGDEVNFVFVSRLMKEKGIDQYLDAAEYITKKYPGTKFHICGFCEDEYKDKLAALTESESVIYHGMVKDMMTILPDMHCTVHPTYYPEGLSNVLLESCATGRPIITTDRAGCREVVENGVNGYVCRQKDSEDLICQIEKFLALTPDERREMGLAGRAKVEREFDRNIVIDKYLKELSDI